MSSIAQSPVNPNASKEAKALLEYLYSISGKQILSGQHCHPLAGSTRLPTLHRAVGHYPAVFGQDFGFSAPGSWDGIDFRQNIVNEAIRRHHEGFIITLMWHAVPPTMEEPVTFEEGIQTKLTDKEWMTMLTPETELNERWKSQVDVIAWHLKQIRNAGVPVLWRPYHEMNGNWFWWSQRTGDDGYAGLYRMLYERLTHFHKLDNLIWVYNCNEEKPGIMGYGDLYPGHDYVDVLATDVYTENFSQENYESILKVAGDKPIALGEVGPVPSLEILEKQPRWTWFMAWFELGMQYKEWEGYKKLFDHERCINHDDLSGCTVRNPQIHAPILK